MPLKTGSLKFQVLRPDWDDISEFEIIASSNDWHASLKFSGYADVFKDFANKLKTFPDSKLGDVAFELGEEFIEKKPKWAYYLLLRVYCYDKFGHTAIEIAINNNEKDRDQKMARFSIFSEPEQINKLGRLLSEWDPTRQSVLIWETNI